LFKVMLL